MAIDPPFPEDDDPAAAARGPNADKDFNPGTPSTASKTDYQRRKTRNRAIAVGGSLGALALAYAVYLSSIPGLAPKVVTPPPKSASTFTPPRESVTAPRQNTAPLLEIAPPGHAFGTMAVGEPRRTRAFAVTARTGTFEIAQVSLPYGQDQGMTLASGSAGCQGKTLRVTEQCIVAVTFDPKVPLIASVLLSIVGTKFDDTTGKSEPFSQTAEITGTATAPLPVAAATPLEPIPRTVEPELGSGTVSQPPGTQGSRVTNPIDDSGLADARSAFLAGRQRPTLSGGSFLTASNDAASSPRRPLDADWQSAGFQASVSTYPVDLTRILTMDKPIPAVIKVSIDARSASRAVAQVERDMYGSDGRTVVVERGSILVGTVASVSSSSDEKVAIAWQRVMRPDGVIFKITAASGDAMGRSGVLAHMDNRLWERFGQALLASVIDAVGIASTGASQTQTNTGGTSSSGVTSGGTSATTLNAPALAVQAIQSNISPLIKQYQNEQSNLPVLRTVPAGTRITVWATEDLILRPVETREGLAEAAALQARLAARSARGNQDQGQGQGFGLGSPQGFQQGPLAGQQSGVSGPPVRSQGGSNGQFTVPDQNPGTGLLPPAGFQPQTDAGANPFGPSGAGVLRSRQQEQQRQEAQRPQLPEGYDTMGILPGSGAGLPNGAYSPIR